MRDLPLLPIISEKSMELVEGRNTYVFEVPLDATKIQIAKAVGEEFKVKVENVNTTLRKGKMKHQRVKGGRQTVYGRQKDLKKAYVTLKPGDSIKLFEGGE